MKKIILIILFSFGVIATAHNFSGKIREYVIVDYRQFQNVTKESLNFIPDDYLLSMVAIHEAVNLCSMYECALIMQSTWNRVECNWGNYGDLKGQLRSSEFKGLIDKNFKFNPDNPKHIQCLEIAREIISGKKYHKKEILGWNKSTDPNQEHLAICLPLKVKTKEKTIHWFWQKP